MGVRKGSIMAKKKIRKEDVSPSYEELISELSGIISKLLIESAAKTITIQKLEKIVNDLSEDDIESDKEVF
jgi:exonuclease VII small subunit